MSNFANLSANLNLNIQNFSTNMRRASVLMSQFASNMSGQINAGMVDPAKKAKVEYKDVARIVQGILISKVFYGGLNAIRAATDSVWEFSKQLEYAKIAYSNLFGDQALALEFINVLKDFAAVTPFSFQESEAAAKRLLAYGVQYKNVMYMMKGVLAASSMQGNPQVIESISRALGQIYTKGRLMNEEMRQLAEAGIPAYQILQEKLGLTSKQLQNLGREAIPASKAINALVDGMTERFGNVIDASVMTLQGIISNLKDNATMLFASMFDPLTQRIKSVLADVGNFMAKMRQLQELKGNGGVFEALIPEKSQEMVRLFIANLQILWRVVKQNIGLVLEMAGKLLSALIPALNVIIPIVVSILNVFGHLQKAFLSNSTAVRVLVGALAACAFAWALFRTQAILTAVVAKLIGIINGISKAVLFLSAALVRSPVVTMMILISAAILGVSIASDKAGGAITNLMKKLTGLNGVKTSTVMQPVDNKQASDLSKFNNELDDTADSMDKVNDKAKKATKSLLSFDEVYQLGSGADGSDTAADETMEEIDLSGLGGLSGDALIPEIPSFEDFSTDFVKTLQESIGAKLVSSGIGMVIGGALGAIIGGLIGGPAGALLGAKIGMVAGAIAGWFWEELVNYFQTPQGIGVGIGTGIGAVIGGIVGGPAGALIGAAIGGLVSWLVGYFWDEIKEYFSDPSIGGAYIGAGIGAAIGFCVGGPPGAAIGAGIGALVGYIVGLFWPQLKEALEDPENVSIPIGTSLGSSISACMGGSTGALIGVSVGALVGWIAQLVKDNWPQITQYFEDGWTESAKSFDEAKINLGNKMADILDNTAKWSESVRTSIAEGFKTGCSNAQINMDLLKEATDIIFESIRSSIAERISGIAEDIKTNFDTATQNMRDSLTDMRNDAITGLGNIYSTFTDWIKDMWDNVFDSLFGWIKDALEALKDLNDEKGGGTTVTKATTVKPVVPKKKAATGGIITKEDVVHVGEGNKKESIIPLDNLEAMKPFSDAVSAGIAQVLLPLVANISSNNSGGSGGQTGIVVNAGVIVADDASLKVLERRLAVARAEEDTRRG